jgi:prefoldin subunit 5
MTDPVAQLQNILNNTTGIDQQLNSIQQRTKAVTDLKSYLNDYSTALKLLKQRGSDRVKQL